MTLTHLGLDVARRNLGSLCRVFREKVLSHLWSNIRHDVSHKAKFLLLSQQYCHDR